jgi:hypothetical protein
MRQTVVQIVAGVVVALLGLLWILQGLDLLGQDGGMNDQLGWAFAGVVVLVGGLALLAGGVRGWRRRRR